MSGEKGKKDFDDVGSLVNQLQLGGVRYREFGKPRPSAQPVPAATAVPAVMPTTATAPTVATPAPRAVATASPLAFTFERLRRQAPTSAARAPFITLNLPERHAVFADRLRGNPQQRTFAAVFAELEGHARNRAVA